MNRQEYKYALFTNGRRYEDATYRLNCLIRQKRLSLRAAGSSGWSTEEDDSIRQEVEGRGEIGALTEKIDEIERSRAEIECLRIRAELKSYLGGVSPLAG
jgi:hypothetical protein